MNVQVAELRAAFDGVWSRFDPPKRKNLIIGMALPLGVGKEAPTRLHVFPLGEPPSNDERKWRFTTADLTRAVEAFKARTEPLPILYDHGNDPSKGSRAAGWVDSVDLAHDGLYANVHWTDKAREEIRSGEWGFRSPGWEGETDDNGFIYAGPLNEISLVNKPAIGGMPPVVASSQPSTQPEQRILDLQPTPPAKEQKMANDVTAARKAATAPDMAAVLDVLRKGFPDMFGAGAPDTMVAEYFSDLLEGGVEDAPDKNPVMPGADAKPTTPAVPLAPFASAEDVAKHVEAATAAATDISLKLVLDTEEATKKIGELTAQVKALQARELSGKIVNASAADRAPVTPKTFAERIREQRVAGMRS